MLHLKSTHQLKLEIDSAGTANYHVGEAPDRRTIANAKKNGVDLSALRARQFCTKDFDDFDQIYVMDRNNLRNVLNMAKNEAHKNKVSLFLSDAEVPDRYYGGEEDFEHVFQLVYKNCERLAGI